MVCSKCGATLVIVPLRYVLCGPDGYREASATPAFCPKCGNVGKE